MMLRSLIFVLLLLMPLTVSAQPPASDTYGSDEASRKNALRDKTCTDSGLTSDQCFCMEMSSLDNGVSLIELEWFYLDKQDKLTAPKKKIIEKQLQGCKAE